MDLALEMGMTAAGLSRAMTERELMQWQSYAARRMLPMRRLELYLAQIALVVVKAAGGAKNATLADLCSTKRRPPTKKKTSTQTTWLLSLVAP